MRRPTSQRGFQKGPQIIKQIIKQSKVNKAALKGNSNLEKKFNES